MDIILTTPIQQTAITRVRVSNITDNPQRQELDFRLTLGYTNVDGGWVEVQDYHKVIQNLPAILDDPKTTEDESKPANPQYDNLQTLIKTSGKTAEEIILNQAKTRFPGTVQ